MKILTYIYWLFASACVGKVMEYRLYTEVPPYTFLYYVIVGVVLAFIFTKLFHYFTKSIFKSAKNDEEIKLLDTHPSDISVNIAWSLVALTCFLFAIFNILNGNVGIVSLIDPDALIETIAYYIVFAIPLLTLLLNYKRYTQKMVMMFIWVIALIVFLSEILALIYAVIIH